MNKSKELATNTAILAIGKISTQFLSFLLIPLYTFVLAPEAYGFVDLTVLYTGLLAPTITIQMEMAVFRLLVDERKGGDHNSRARTISSAGTVFLMGMVAGTLLLLSISAVFDVRHRFIIVGLFLSLIAIGAAFQITRGLGSNKHYSIASIIIGSTAVILNLIFLLVLELGAAGILLANMLANFTGVAYLVAAMQIYKYLHFRSVSKSKIQELLTYSWPLVPNHISIWGINGVSRTIVSVTLGIGAVGIFAIASKLSLIYTHVYSIFAMSWTESAALHIKSKDNFISAVTDTTIRVFGSFASVLIASLALAFPLIVGKGFEEAQDILPILFVGSFLGSIVAHYGAIYLAVKNTKKVAIVTLQALVLSSIITLVLVPVIGLLAPAIALVVTNLYIAFRRHLDVQKYVVIRYRAGTFPAVIGLATVSIGAYYLNIFPLNIISLCVVTIGAILLNWNIVKKALPKILYRSKRNNHEKPSKRIN